MNFVTNMTMYINLTMIIKKHPNTVYYMYMVNQCAVPESVHLLSHPPTEGIGISWGRGILRPKKLKKCVKINWNFQRGGDLKIRKNPP